MSEKLLNRIQNLTIDKMPIYVGNRSKNTSLVMDESNFYAVLLSASQLENYLQLKVDLIHSANTHQA
jgi:hypothetical protein